MGPGFLHGMIRLWNPIRHRHLQRKSCCCRFEDDTFAIVIEGDMVAGEGRMTNGVAMVPLRLTAELCGFTVKWNAKDRTVHLTNGTVQTTVTIGWDAYFRANSARTRTA